MLYQPPTSPQVLLKKIRTSLKLNESILEEESSKLASDESGISMSESRAALHRSSVGRMVTRLSVTAAENKATDKTFLSSTVNNSVLASAARKKFFPDLNAGRY